MANTFLLILRNNSAEYKLVEVINLEDANKQEKEAVESSEEVKDETVEETQSEDQSEEIKEDVSEETEEDAEPSDQSDTKESEETSDEQEETTKSKDVKTETKGPSEKQKPKKEDKKETGKKKVDRGPDFKYIVRLSNTDVDGEKNIVYGLASIKGIGVNMATLIADESGIDRKTKMGYLKDAQIEKLQELIDSVIKKAPVWMLNRRKDYETGEDIHLIGSEIDMALRDEINVMKKIRSYRGIRHERGLPVRGQRTRANNRKGLALGVSKKREPTTTTTTAK